MDVNSDKTPHSLWSLVRELIIRDDIYEVTRYDTEYRGYYYH